MTRLSYLPTGYKECANPGCNNAFKQYRTTDRDCSRKCYLERTKSKRSRLNRKRYDTKQGSDRLATLLKPTESVSDTFATQGVTQDVSGASKFGWLEVGGKSHYFRSSWERNYARYLEWLKSVGEIKDWEYESQMFEFPLKHGTTRYLPDFKVIENNGSSYFIEIKGFMKQKDRTKIKRMALYHPDVRLELLDATGYKALEKDIGKLIPEWE